MWWKEDLKGSTPNRIIIACKLSTALFLVLVTDSLSESLSTPQISSDRAKRH